MILRFLWFLVALSSICPDLLAQTSTDTIPHPVGQEMSVVQLLSSPEKYDGQLVRVRGYLNLAYEAHALYGQADDVLSHRLKNGVWVDFAASVTNQKKLTDYNQTYVIVVGRFDAHSKGHLGLFGGTLANITNLDKALLTK